MPSLGGQCGVVKGVVTSWTEVFLEGTKTLRITVRSGSVGEKVSFVRVIENFCRTW